MSRHVAGEKWAATEVATDERSISKYRIARIAKKLAQLQQWHDKVNNLI